MAFAGDALLYFKSEGLNNSLRGRYGRRAEVRYQLKIEDIINHLQATDKSDYIFYTNSNFSHFPLFTLDVDCNDTTTEDDIELVLQLLFSLNKI